MHGTGGLLMSQRIAISEGSRRRFEVFESIDGFTVRAAGLDGVAPEVDCADQAVKLFRTAPAAFAFAEMAASRERLETSRGGGAVDLDAVLEHHASARRFEDLRLALGDEGVPASLLGAWARAEEAAARRHYH
jgi:hypothetical protein